jgi:cobalt-precorrin-5B (C1)-methyltransferase
MALNISRNKTKSKRGLRTGYTTGACAAASAKAAALALISQSKADTVEISLPQGESVSFLIHSTRFTAVSAQCSVIKDAGDDPDVTHGAEIFAEVKRNREKEIRIFGGEGVGVVTKPGLGLTIGDPAINPVPRMMIGQAIRSVDGSGAGYDVIISVPEGKNLAKKTLNARLGIVGGISILGTRGTVIPYSTSAYKCCVAQAVNMAVASGWDTIVLTTGSRTEKAAIKLMSLGEEAFIQMGDFVGHAMKSASRTGIKKVIIVAMIGKMSKIASGARQTHAKNSTLKMDVLAKLAERMGLPKEVIEQIKKAQTARHVYEIMPENLLHGFVNELCGEAARQCRKMTEDKVSVECILVDFDGSAIGRG